jgi:GNAT superfamily N-acetyltransferase
MTPSIEYRNQLPDPHAFFTLFQTTGWNAKYAASAEELFRAIENSWATLSAYDGPSLVGFGRAVCDGTMHAVIFDLIVHPDSQGRGIGSAILARLVAECRQAGIRDIQLFSARGKHTFYEKRGFRVRPADAPGMEWVDSPS